MTRLRNLILVLLLPLAACGGPADRSADTAKLMQTSRDWSRAAAGGNLDAILAYWADDAVVIQPGEPTLRGKAQIRAYLERSLKAPGFRIAWEPVEGAVSADGTMGYLVENTVASVTGPDGKPVTQRYRGVTVWRKQPDGSWKAAEDMITPGPAA